MTKEEQREYGVAYYWAHREKRLAYGYAHRGEKRKRDVRRQRWFNDNLRILKQTQGCDNCGTCEGRLEHHHVDPNTKAYSVSNMRSNSLEMFMDEIAKCTVQCPPCHKDRHAEMKAIAA